MMDNNNTVSDMEIRAKFFSKMSRITGAVGTLTKDATNEFHHYGYVSAANVLETLAPLMAKENIALISETLEVGIDDKVYMPKYQFTFVCGDTGFMFPCIWFGETVHTSNKGTRDDKALNKSATISQKYFLLKTFLIATGDDPDGDKGDAGRKPQKKQSKSKSKVKAWNEDPAQVEKFTAWCKSAMEEHTLDNMLSALNQALVTPLTEFSKMTQYPGDKMHAMDAIIAYECGYDNSVIADAIGQILPDATEEQYSLHSDAIELINKRVNARQIQADKELEY